MCTNFCYIILLSWSSSLTTSRRLRMSSIFRWYDVTTDPATNIDSVHSCIEHFWTHMDCQPLQKKAHDLKSKSVVAGSCAQQLISLLKLASYKQLGAGAALY